MTSKSVDEVPEKNEYFLETMNLCVRIREDEITGRGYDEKRDEYHESTRTVSDETEFVECTLESIEHEETGEQLDSEDVERFAQDIGFDEVERVDYDAVRYVLDGEPYIAVYDMTPFEKLL